MEKFQNKYLEIKNISKDIVNWVEDVAEENNCKIERKEWKSKYNYEIVMGDVENGVWRNYI